MGDGPTPYDPTMLNKASDPTPDIPTAPAISWDKAVSQGIIPQSEVPAQAGVDFGANQPNSTPPSDGTAARATFYGNFEDPYGSQTARPGIDGKSQAQTGVTIAVDPKIIPYGSKVYVPQLKDYSANKDGIFFAHDTGGAVKSQQASGGAKPVIDFYSGDAKTSKDLAALNQKYGDNISYSIIPPS